MAVSHLTNSDKAYAQLYVADLTVTGDFIVEGKTVYDGDVEVKGVLTADGGIAIPEPTLPANLTSSLVVRGSGGAFVLGNPLSVPLPTPYSNASGLTRVNVTCTSGQTLIYSCPTGRSASLFGSSLWWNTLSSPPVSTTWYPQIRLDDGATFIRISPGGTLMKPNSRADTIAGFGTSYVLHSGEALFINSGASGIVFNGTMLEFSNNSTGLIADNTFRCRTILTKPLNTTPQVLYTCPSVNPDNGLAISNAYSIMNRVLSSDLTQQNLGSVTVFVFNDTSSSLIVTIAVNTVTVAQQVIVPPNGGPSARYDVGVLKPGDVVTAMVDSASDPNVFAWMTVCEV